MKYEKPEAVLLASATFAIQRSQKDNTTWFDGGEFLLSPMAYEADE